MKIKYPPSRTVSLIILGKGSVYKYESGLYIKGRNTPFLDGRDNYYVWDLTEGAQAVHGKELLVTPYPNAVLILGGQDD